MVVTLDCHLRTVNLVRRFTQTARLMGRSLAVVGAAVVRRREGLLRVAADAAFVQSAYRSPYCRPGLIRLGFQAPILAAGRSALRPLPAPAKRAGPSLESPGSSGICFCHRHPASKLRSLPPIALVSSRSVLIPVTNVVPAEGSIQRLRLIIEQSFTPLIRRETSLTFTPVWVGHHSSLCFD